MLLSVAGGSKRPAAATIAYFGQRGPGAMVDPSAARYSISAVGCRRSDLGTIVELNHHVEPTRCGVQDSAELAEVLATFVPNALVSDGGNVVICRDRREDFCAPLATAAHGERELSALLRRLQA